MEQGKKEASNNNSGSNSGNTGNKSRSNKRRRNNRNRRPNNKQQAKGAKSQDQKQGKPQGQNKNKSQKASSNAAPKKGQGNRNRKRRPQGRNRRSGTSHLKGEDFVIVKYLNLLEQHIMARKKYFENFDRVGDKQKQKLEKNFIDTQKTFLDFKGRLKPEELQIFEKKFESLKMDTTYANNHKLPLGEVDPEVTSEEIEDPHYLQTQIQADYSEDTEESMGSLDDYKAYKGIS